MSESVCEDAQQMEDGLKDGESVKENRRSY